MKLKQLFNSSGLLIGLTLVFVAVIAKRETINSSTQKAIGEAGTARAGEARSLRDRFLTQDIN